MCTRKAYRNKIPDKVLVKYTYDYGVKQIHKTLIYIGLGHTG